MRQGRIFYGWYIVAVAFVSNFMATGTGFYIFNAFMNPLCEQRGWTRTELNAAPAIGMVIGLLSTLLYGTLVTRVGPRLLMVVGSVVSGIAFACLGWVKEIAYLYLFFALLFLGNGAMSGIVANTAVSNWFEKKRGKAVGLATAGVSLSGAVLPYLAMLMLEHSSLTHVFLWIGVMVWIVAPVSWVVVRDRPELYGLAPDGLLPGDTHQDAVQDLPQSLMTAPYGTLWPKGSVPGGGRSLWTPSRILRTQAFWMVGFSYALVMMGVVGVMYQLAPRFTDIGYDRRMAMAMLSVTALIGAAGKTFWGMLCDWFEPKRVAAVLMAMNGVGLVMALPQGSHYTLILFIILFGFAMGGVMSTFPVLIAELFGRESFAPVTRFLALFLFLQGAGYLMMGQSFDRTGSYNLAYSAFILLDIMAALLILSVKRPLLPFQV